MEHLPDKETLTVCPFPHKDGEGGRVAFGASETSRFSGFRLPGCLGKLRFLEDSGSDRSGGAYGNSFAAREASVALNLNAESIDSALQSRECKAAQREEFIHFLHAEELGSRGGGGRGVGDGSVPTGSTPLRQLGLWASSAAG